MCGDGGTTFRLPLLTGQAMLVGGVAAGPCPAAMPLPIASSTAARCHAVPIECRCILFIVDSLGIVTATTCPVLGARTRKSVALGADLMKDRRCWYAFGAAARTGSGSSRYAAQKRGVP